MTSSGCDTLSGPMYQPGGASLPREAPSVAAPCGSRGASDSREACRRSVSSGENDSTVKAASAVAARDLLEHAGKDSLVAGVALAVVAADEVSQRVGPCSGPCRARPRRGGP